MEDIIICGSRKYSNVDIDKIVDSFETIVRHNMLVSNCGYGLRDSTVQVMNSHVYRNYRSFSSIEQWKKYYANKVPSDGHIERFYSYINEKKETKYISFPNNNVSTISHLFHKHEIKTRIGEPKCGLSFVAECIKQDIRPFLVGYSISNETILDHQYNNHKNLYPLHNHSGEARLICELHQKGLVDASLCLITDNGLSKEFEPTTYSKERWGLK